MMEKKNLSFSVPLFFIILSKVASSGSDSDSDVDFFVVQAASQQSFSDAETEEDSTESDLISDDNDDLQGPFDAYGHGPEHARVLHGSDELRGRVEVHRSESVRH